MCSGPATNNRRIHTACIPEPLSWHNTALHIASNIYVTQCTYCMYSMPFVVTYQTWYCTVHMYICSLVSSVREVQSAHYPQLSAFSLQQAFALYHVLSEYLAVIQIFQTRATRVLLNVLYLAGCISLSSNREVPPFSPSLYQSHITSRLSETMEVPGLSSATLEVRNTGPGGVLEYHVLYSVRNGP